MPSFNVYLAATLPMLHFGARPPLSSQQFLERCAELILQEELSILKAASQVAPDFIYQGPCPALSKWCDFNIALNNEIVKIRASRRRLEAQKYLRPHQYPNFDLAHIAAASHRNPLLSEAEKLLDQARWKYLEELSVGHYFDLDFLVVYLEKLLILERWERIRTAKGQELMDKVLTEA